MKNSNYRKQKINCCSTCQFCLDINSTIFHSLKGIRCSHKGNEDLDIEENGICDFYTKPYSIPEKEFKKQLAKEYKY